MSRFRVGAPGHPAPDLDRGGRDLYSMPMVDQILLDLVNAGIIGMEVATYASSNPEEFERNVNII